MPQRRRFLLQLGAASVALSLGKAGEVLAAAPASAPAAADFSVSAFAPMVGRPFKLVRDGASADLRLARVVPLKNAQGHADEKRARERCFTLVFRSEQPSALEEGIYEFSTAGRPAFSAFMSPILGDKRSYQVVFSQV
ncbi:DUF6916 family protein [Dokdonella fugitiva]|jgi:hypothetical protein|uniref:DUF6916 domain-containing protein n=1 Tax=Dokdonella fugitiva TaxID=328517 RepID=A0A4V2S1X4_9GAMM|nr:hypothetical protein [Dokdonella fugitiva]TCO38240.1 hypothetical protein EV148_10876 [Dokdonella fugitiva]